MANISFNEFMGKLSGKVEGFKTTVQEGKLMSASLQEVIDKTIRENSERIRRCAEVKNALAEYFNGIKISHQDIANAGVKVDDLDNYHMLVRDLVEEKPNSRDAQEKEETPWYSRMAPMEATFGVKLFNNGDKQ